MASGVFRINRRAFSGGVTAAALVGCSRKGKVNKDADVIIIGAGLSGLFSAMWLQDAGYEVKVVEASSRIGGRMWTLDDLPGQPEAGGSQVGQSYARIRYAADRVGLAIIDDKPGARIDRLLSIGNKQILQSEWATAPENVLPEVLKRSPPDSALFAAAAPGNPLDWAGAWRDGSAFSKDQSAEDYLRSLGSSDEAIRLMNVALNANDLSTYSMLNVWRSLQLYTQDRDIGPSGSIEGGSQRLPEAMAAMVGDVTTEFSVAAIENTADGVTVTSHGGDALRADFCVAALPFPALAKISVAPVPSGAQASAIAALPYTQILQLHVEPETPFWETDGYSATMWTDGPLERVFTITDKDTNNISSLLAWVNGETARSLGSETDDTLQKIVSAEFLRTRPASEGRVKLRKAIRWTEGQSYAGGAYMHWAPGQAEKWANTMGAPIGRIHFAGEHLSYLHTGMEGAMESGQNAAEAIIDAST